MNPELTWFVMSYSYGEAALKISTYHPWKTEEK